MVQQNTGMEKTMAPRGMWELSMELRICLWLMEWDPKWQWVMHNLKDLSFICMATLIGNDVSGDSKKKHHFRNASKSSFMTQGLCTFFDWLSPRRIYQYFLLFRMLLRAISSKGPLLISPPSTSTSSNRCYSYIRVANITQTPTHA